MVSTKWKFGHKPQPDPVQMIGDDALHPHGDVEIVDGQGANFELTTRGEHGRKVSVDIPQKSMAINSDEEIAEEEAARKLKTFRKAAAWDPNIEIDELDAVDEAVAHHDAKGEDVLVSELVENSPYPEVC